MLAVNFALHPMASKERGWKHSWEKSFLEGSRSGFFRNTFADMERIIGELAERFGTLFEFESYDLGHLYKLGHLLDRGLVKSKPFVQFVIGIPGRIGADADNLSFLKQPATRLFGDYIECSALPAGRRQMPHCTMAANPRGNARVWFEDSPCLARRLLTESNPKQVEKITRTVSELQIGAATPSEARRRLQIAQ
ncbi:MULTISPECIES: 3-keto-5-aminohexanoate cleavage protein [unclassified Mesorhizobium]|uniref:3-keto-5-aminohexanoate cleavage protein n=1 Tax=unclassified Mesorhizobium TaxID=325217 RepID=UPI00333CC4C4